MPSDPNHRAAITPETILSSGADQPMSAEQAGLLKRLSIEAYELEAFDEHLTHSEAERRIATLRAKLKLIDAPPHTL